MEAWLRKKDVRSRKLAKGVGVASVPPKDDDLYHGSGYFSTAFPPCFFSRMIAHFFTILCTCHCEFSPIIYCPSPLSSAVCQTKHCASQKSCWLTPVPTSPTPAPPSIPDSTPSLAANPITPPQTRMAREEPEPEWGLAVWLRTTTGEGLSQKASSQPLLRIRSPLLLSPKSGDMWPLLTECVQVATQGTGHATHHVANGRRARSCATAFAPPDSAPWSPVNAVSPQATIHAWAGASGWRVPILTPSGREFCFSVCEC